MKTRRKIIIIITALIFFGLLTICILLALESSHNKVQPIVKCQVRCAEYLTPDRRITELIPILKAREGLRLTPYQLRGDPHYYIGYGHQILKTERLPRIDSTQADVILIKDLYKCITECHRVKAPVTQDNLYSIFISGKLGCKVNKRYVK